MEANTLNTLKGRYSQLSTNRSPFLMRARECSKLTIPTLLPPEGSNGSTKLPTPYQSLGARGINNLAAKFLFALLPPNSPIFRLTVDDFTLAKLAQRPGMRAEVERAFSSMERAVMTDIETSGIRPEVLEAIKMLLVSGNCLVFFAPEGSLRVFKLDQYVCKRDPAGNVLEIVTCEKLSQMEIPDHLKEMGVSASPKPKGQDADDTVELFTCIKNMGDHWQIYQELNGHTIAESYGKYPKDKCPWRALRLVSVNNEDYGRGYVEEYLGDLKSLEALSRAIVQGAAAAAKVLFLVKPNGTTSAKTLATSESGDIREGNKDDVTVLQMDKYADFKIAQEMRAQLIQGLSYVFMIASAVQRSGERVTAEEIRAMIKDLEEGLGGIHASLSRDLQLPLVVLRMAHMQSTGKLPRLPEGVVKPMIITGVEAIGRGQDLNKLQQFISILQPLGPEAIQSHSNIDDLIQRVGTSLGIDTDGLIPTKDEIAQRQQQAQMQQMAQKLGPAAINQIGGAVRDQAT